MDLLGLRHRKLWLRSIAVGGFLLFSSISTAAPTCSSSSSDTDGDGWGWENNRSCRVVAASSGNSSGSASGICASSISDPDGDGWGWEAGRSCRVVQQTGTPTCSSSATDSDGDGWGFENGRSCRVASNAQPTVTVQSGSSQSSAGPVSGNRPYGVTFKTNTLRRVGRKGDNWDQTWAADGSVITSMDDGEWNTGEYKYHNRLYRIRGEADNFSRSEITNYPNFHTDGDGWFGYGVLSVNGVLYSMVSKTQTGAWSYGPFRGVKMLRSYDNGNNWYRVDRYDNDRYLGRWDNARELLNDDEMFFFEEYGRYGSGKQAYPFSYLTFVQQGQDHRESTDGYVYMYAPEGAESHQLLLARAPASQLGRRSAWQYFSGWNGEQPTWTSNIQNRKPNLYLPDKNNRGEYFGWYSWLPSVVWNPGLGLYVMVNGGTYGGYGMSNGRDDHYSKWMHTKSGSLGFWYSENPYGPWKQFYYTDYWTADDANNLTYQPKLSPKWISADGRTMTLVWSDAMRNQDGYSHSINYKWNQMDVEIRTR